MKQTILLSIFLLSACASVSAQPRPGAFTTLVTTNPTVSSACFGCTLASSQPVINSGIAVAAVRIPPLGTPTATTDTLFSSGGGLFFGSNQLFNVGGLLRVSPSASGVSVVGSSSISSGATGTQSFNVANTAAGTSNQAQILVSGNGATTVLQQLSSTFTSSGILGANGSILSTSGANFTLATSSATANMRFVTNQGATSTPMATFYASGGVSIGNTTDPTAATLTVGASSDTTISASGYAMTTWPTTASAANANVANGAAVKLSTSLRANKHDIIAIRLSDARRTVMGLKPVLYQSAVDDDQREWAGFIAEDVQAVNPTLAVYRPDGALQSVSYDRVPAYLVPVVQDQQRRIEALEAQVKALLARQ